MIDESTLISFRHFFKDDRQLEKDYLINLLLKVISINRFSNCLEFKGGTALYLFHGMDRFSEDLDFTYSCNDARINEDIDAFLAPIISDFGLSYNISKNKGNMVIRDDGGRVSGVRTELFIEGPLFSKTGIRHKVKMDISIRNDLIMKPEAAHMVSRYADVGTILIYKMPVAEMLAEKLCSILERARARDIYDAYFIMRFSGAAYDGAMLAGKLGKRGEGFDKAVLLNRIEGFSEPAWKEELSYIIKDMPDLSYAKQYIISRIS